MKVSVVKAKLGASESFQVEMMRNPANLVEWVIWIREPLGKSFLLTNELDVVITHTDANQCLLLLRSLGIKSANIVL
jgi:hypothetical protein